jgi:hypothetical protein
MYDVLGGSLHEDLGEDIGPWTPPRLEISVAHAIYFHTNKTI